MLTHEPPHADLNSREVGATPHNFASECGTPKDPTGILPVDYWDGSVDQSIVKIHGKCHTPLVSECAPIQSQPPEAWQQAITVLVRLAGMQKLPV